MNICSYVVFIKSQYKIPVKLFFVVFLRGVYKKIRLLRPNFHKFTYFLRIFFIILGVCKKTYFLRPAFFQFRGVADYFFSIRPISLQISYFSYDFYLWWGVGQLFFRIRPISLLKQLQNYISPQCNFTTKSTTQQNKPA